MAILEGCVRSDGVVKFTHNTSSGCEHCYDRECTYYGCIEWEGVHAGQVKVINPGDCDDTYYGCIDWPDGGKFKISIPGVCCAVPRTNILGYLYDFTDCACANTGAQMPQPLSFENVGVASALNGVYITLVNSYAPIWGYCYFEGTKTGSFGEIIVYYNKRDCESDCAYPAAYREYFFDRLFVSVVISSGSVMGIDASLSYPYYLDCEGGQHGSRGWVVLFAGNYYYKEGENCTEASGGATNTRINAPCGPSGILSFPCNNTGKIRIYE